MESPVRSHNGQPSFRRDLNPDHFSSFCFTVEQMADGSSLTPSTSIPIEVRTLLIERRPQMNRSMLQPGQTTTLSGDPDTGYEWSAPTQESEERTMRGENACGRAQTLTFGSFYSKDSWVRMLDLSPIGTLSSNGDIRNIFKFPVVK